MIITRTPFRVSFCGGGSDMASFYEEHSGCVLSTSINKYMYLSIHPYFSKGTTVLKYSQNEVVNDLDAIQHKIFKQALKKFQIEGVEITSTADIPAGTGLGSSSSFTVGLLHMLYSYQGKYISKERLAAEACRMEIDDLKEPIGKQDQYAAAYGGLNYIKFNRDGSVVVEPVIMKGDTYKRLEENLLMFYTGDVRSASAILKEQKENVKQKDKANNLIKMCGLTNQLKQALENNNLSLFGEIMHESWLLKKTLAFGISNEFIDDMYNKAIKNGALGGKLLGAGGGGFLLFYVQKENQEKLRNSLKDLRELEFDFDFRGSSIIYVGEKDWT